MQNSVKEKDLTANQLYKEYKDEGGTLKFSDWLTREKTKGIFPLNSNLNEEVQKTLKTVKEEQMKNLSRIPSIYFAYCGWSNYIGCSGSKNV